MHQRVAPGIDITIARCEACGHEIRLEQFTQGIEPELTEGQSLFVLPSELDFADDARRVLRERMVVLCPNCNKKMKVGKRLAGQVIRCVSCSAEIRIPEFQTEEEFDDEMYLMLSIPAALGDAADESIRRSRAAVRARIQEKHELRNYWQLLCIAAGVFVLATVAVIFFRYSNSNDNDIDGGNGDGSFVVTSGGDKTGKPEGGTKDKQQPRTAVQTGRRGRLTTAQWSIFASKGSFPARAGYVYCRLTAELYAGNKPLKLPNAGRKVSLHLSSGQFKSLGFPVGESIVPVQSRRRTIRISPGQSGTYTFLFEIPARSDKGELRIADFAPMPISLKIKRHQQDMAGEFIEVPPRNLKPLLRDPVMAALQATPRQKLIVEKKDGEYSVSIPAAGIVGSGTLLKEGLCKLEMRKGENMASAKLQLAPDGNCLILHLRDKPMHQITYQRITARGDRPMHKPVDMSVKPEPEPRSEEPKPRPDEEGDGVKAPENDNKAPSFFGVKLKYNP